MMLEPAGLLVSQTHQACLTAFVPVLSEMLFPQYSDYITPSPHSCLCSESLPILISDYFFPLLYFFVPALSTI